MPTSVKVGPYRYSVLATRETINQVRVNVRSGAQGATEFERQVITIDPEMARDHKAEVLLHEVLHVVQDAVGIGSKEKIEAHEMIYRTAPTLLETLRANPELVAFLTSED